MIQGIGMDLLELDRIQKNVARGAQLAKRVLTVNEFKIYEAFANQHRKVEFLAGRFAAKEAFSKAAGTGIGKLGFHDIEVLPTESGAPMLTAVGYEVHKIFVSITHTAQYAAAQVIIES